MAWLQSKRDIVRGFPSPGIYDRRPVPFKEPPLFGTFLFNLTRAFSRGSAAYVVHTGQVTYNPIGAGVVPLGGSSLFSDIARPAARYDHGIPVYATAPYIPTSIPLIRGMYNPADLRAMLVALPPAAPPVAIY